MNQPIKEVFEKEIILTTAIIILAIIIVGFILHNQLSSLENKIEVNSCPLGYFCVNLSSIPSSAIIKNANLSIKEVNP